VASKQSVRPSRHLVLCGPSVAGPRPAAWQDVPVVRLRLGLGRADVRLRIEHVTKAMSANVPDPGTDLLELAAYVYAADQAAHRGEANELDYGGRWRRHFRFEVPVRSPDLWNRPAVTSTLCRTLGFLSDDDYEFAFRPWKDPPGLDRYILGGPGAGGLTDFEEVILFSGGLDSLGGAVREALVGKRRVALVSHRPAPHVYARQRRLAAQIALPLLPRERPFHVAVEVTKGPDKKCDFTQRSRSFLFAAMAAVVARVCGRPRIRFYENGVVSLNLPYSPQVLGGRATRTTHPQVLRGFAELFTLLFETPFAVDNPFQWTTKAGALADVKAAGHGLLCAGTCSCAHTLFQQAERPHCGRCSQCVDRRLSALAAGLTDAEDPAGRYVDDVVTGVLCGEDALLAERYVGMLLRVDRIRDARAFLIQFPEVARALRYAGETAASAADRAFDLYRGHAEGVLHALGAELTRDPDALVRRAIAPNCLLGIASPGGVRRQGLASGVPGPAQAVARVLTLDDGLFQARMGSATCTLGNTLDYRMLGRLLAIPGRYLPVETLAGDVWKNDRTSRNAIQRVASSLGRQLRGSGFVGVKIDGCQAGHYRLILPS
jgi:hypothetical protein